jgi:PhoH-like ATPase
LKKFVLDTNVILTDPKCIYKFEDNEIYIPLIVIEELDRNKKGQSEKARAARQFSRSVDAMRANGDLAKGVDLPTGGKLYINTVERVEDIPLGMDLRINDDLILYTAKVLDAIVVSKDLNVRLKADAVGIPAEDYKAGKIVLENDLNSGHSTIRLTEDELNSFREQGFIPYDEGVNPNEYYIMLAENNDKNSALGRYSPKAGSIVKLISGNSVWGIRAKNAEQRFAVDALLNDEISLVSLVGKAGTGKTLLAVACGLQKTLEEKKFQRMLISRPVIPMGKDIGYLPGDINEKLNPWISYLVVTVVLLVNGNH